MTEEQTGRWIFRLAVLVVIGMLVQLSVIVYVAYSQYQGRQDSIAHLRAGCERSKLDRADNARAVAANAANWRQASAVRRRSGDDDVADTYEFNALKQDISANSLTVRSKIVCAKAYPKASFLR